MLHLVLRVLTHSVRVAILLLNEDPAPRKVPGPVLGPGFGRPLPSSGSHAPRQPPPRQGASVRHDGMAPASGMVPASRRVPGPGPNSCQAAAWDRKTGEWCVVKCGTTEESDQQSPTSVLPEGAVEGVDYVIHTVLPSDTFSGICLRYRISALELRRANRFSGTNLRLAPSRLVIPLGKHGLKKGHIRKKNQEQAAPLPQGDQPVACPPGSYAPAPGPGVSRLPPSPGSHAPRQPPPLVRRLGVVAGDPQPLGQPQGAPPPQPQPQPQPQPEQPGGHLPVLRMVPEVSVSVPLQQHEQAKLKKQVQQQQQVQQQIQQQVQQRKAAATRVHRPMQGLHGKWQSKSDINHRRRMIALIERVLQQQKWNATDEWLNTTAKRAEVRLYKSALSLQAYKDPSTLKQRIQLLALSTKS